MDKNLNAYEELKGDNKKTFEIFFKKYYGAIKNYITRLMGYRENGEEITQEVFIKLYKNMESVHPKSIKGWLYTVAHNETINYMKRKKDDVYLDEQGMENIIDCKHLMDMNRHYDRKMILEIFKRLPKNQAYVIYLKDVRGLSYMEIAENLGISYEAVKSLIFRGRQCFIKYYEELNSDEL